LAGFGETVEGDHRHDGVDGGRLLEGQRRPEQERSAVELDEGLGPVLAQALPTTGRHQDRERVHEGKRLVARRTGSVAALSGEVNVAGTATRPRPPPARP